MRRRKGILLLRILLLVIGLVLIGIPFLWIVLTAFKEPVAADASPPIFISPLTLSNFTALFQDNYAQSLLNSLIITALATGFTLIFGIPAGYAFARGKFRGRGFFGAFLLFSRMVPPVIYIIPLFLFFHLLNLIGSFTGLTLAYLTGLLPFTVWMSASYFQGVPVELEEAARVDGASRASHLRQDCAAPGASGHRLGRTADRHRSLGGVLHSADPRGLHHVSGHRRDRGLRRYRRVKLGTHGRGRPVPDRSGLPGHARRAAIADRRSYFWRPQGLAGRPDRDRRKHRRLASEISNMKTWCVRACLPA